MSAVVPRILFVTNLNVCQVLVCDSHHAGSACFAQSSGIQFSLFPKNLVFSFSSFSLECKPCEIKCKFTFQI